MELQHLNVKIFVDGELKVDLQRFIETFHRWVSAQVLDEMLIDVADYRHVPHGPGVVLIGLDADYGMNQTGGRFGLLHNRKAPVEGTNADRLRQALTAAASVCLRLESEMEGLRFSRTEFDLFINDRALAPNTAETFAACGDELTSALQGLLGHDDFELSYEVGDPRRLFTVAVRCARPVELEQLAGAVNRTA